jgi:hypothetical protein
MLIPAQLQVLQITWELRELHASQRLRGAIYVEVFQLVTPLQEGL